MAQYIFTPVTDVLNKEPDGSYGKKLYFQDIGDDYNNTPYDLSTSVKINLASSVKPGDYVYALTRAGAAGEAEQDPLRQAGDAIPYSIDDYKAVQITNVQTLDLGGTKVTEVELSHGLEAPIYGNTGSRTRFDYILFDREFNTLNKVKIGFDKKPSQKVQSLVKLYDEVSTQKLQDETLNDLYTIEKAYFAESLKAINALSVVVNNDSSIPVKVQEAFPTTSQVSQSLLGIPRAETALSLFSDVSTLGIDSANWEYFAYNSGGARVSAWEQRDSDQGKRYQGKLIENIPEQALELSSNTVPYTFPYNESEYSYHDAEEYRKWKNFVFLGNLLFLYFEGTGTEFSYLDPSKTRWGIQGGNFDLAQRRSSSYQVFLNGEGISDEVSYAMIDRWTETWMAIYRGEAGVTETFINNTILNINSNQSLIQKLLDRYESLNQSQFPGTGNSGKRGLMQENAISHLNQPELKFSPLLDNGTQPGYGPNARPNRHHLRSARGRMEQQVILQTKEAYRYQPGRISGFTFGTRVDIDPRSTNNLAEWGCVNDTDEYVFQLAGNKLNIVRRSTVPLTDNSLARSGGFTQADRQYYKTYENYKPVTGGPTKEKFYELTIPQKRWNGDNLLGTDSTGTGYKIDPEKVTMWKIEFSWYGAIGVQFYAYVPIELGEARWVKLHRIIIENCLPQANLQDPYFKMRYNLIIGDRFITTQPQFIYKYGSSVYIDGGDEGTKTISSFKSTQKSVPEDQDAPLSDSNDLVEQNNFVPMIGIQSKRFIMNRDGKLLPNRKIGIPEEMSISTDRMIELDVVESEACADGYGFTYDNGLMWNPNCSPAIASRNNTPNFVARDSGTFTAHGESNDYDLSPYASFVTDIVFQHDGSSSRNVDKIGLVKTQNTTCTLTTTTRGLVGTVNRNKDNEFPRKHQDLTASDTPLMIDATFDGAKINVGGINSTYIDWEATIADSTITKYTSTDVDRGINKTLVSNFRVKKAVSRDYDGTDEDGNITAPMYQIKPVTASRPLFSIRDSGAYFATSTENCRFNWTQYNSLFEKLPRYRQLSGSSAGGHNNSPATSVSANYEYQLKDIYDTNSSFGAHPLTGISTQYTNSNSSYYPFRFFTNGITEDYYVKRGVFRTHDFGGTSLTIPLSYAFGKTILQKRNQAVATVDKPMRGASITCRFLNPYAAGVGLLHNPFTGGKITGGRVPDFEIGFTNRKPTATTAGENNNWDGKFNSPLSDNGTHAPGYLNDNDYISIRNVPQRVNGSVRVGESAFGEGNNRNAHLMQDDYRIKNILNEGQSLTANTGLGYHIGGAPSYVRLIVDPEFTAYNYVTEHDTFAEFKDFYANTGDTYPAGTTVGERLQFPNHPGGVTGAWGTTEVPLALTDSTGSYSRGDFDEFSSAFDHMLVIRDDDGRLGTAIEQAGLNFLGGEIVIRHTNSDGSITTYDETGIFFKSNPVRFLYYGDTTGAITPDAFTAGTKKYAYAFQISGNLNGAGAPINTSTGAEVLGATSSVLFKIVKLQYGDGVNGTDYREVQKVFASGDLDFYPVIKIGEEALLNNINYKVETSGQAPNVISPIWKLYGAAKIAPPVSVNSPQGEVGGLLDNNDLSGGVKNSIPESFEENDRLSGLLFSDKSNKKLRKSVSDPLFVALPNDPAARQTFRTSGVTSSNVQGKYAERCKQITTYYIAPENNAGTITNETLSLYSSFGEDRNRIIPDDLGVKTLFFRAQKTNLLDAPEIANVQVSVNIAEI